MCLRNAILWVHTHTNTHAQSTCCINIIRVHRTAATTRCRCCRYFTRDFMVALCIFCEKIFDTAVLSLPSSLSLARSLFLCVRVRCADGWRKIIKINRDKQECRAIFIWQQSNRKLHTQTHTHTIRFRKTKINKIRQYCVFKAKHFKYMALASI